MKPLSLDCLACFRLAISVTHKSPTTKAKDKLKINTNNKIKFSMISLIPFKLYK